MSERACGCESRSEPCVCGGIVTVTPASGIEAAVRAHQATPEHCAWWERGGFYPSPIDLRHVAESNAASAARWGCAA